MEDCFVEDCLDGFVGQVGDIAEGVVAPAVFQGFFQAFFHGFCVIILSVIYSLGWEEVVGKGSFFYF